MWWRKALQKIEYCYCSCLRVVAKPSCISEGVALATVLKHRRGKKMYIWLYVMPAFAFFCLLLFSN